MLYCTYDFIHGFVFSERFYLDALERIDGDIERQLKDIDSKVQWRTMFRVSFKRSLVLGLNSFLFDQSLLHKYNIIEVGSDSKP